MARGQGTVIVKFLGDASNLQKASDDAGKALGGVSDGAKKMAGQLAGVVAGLGVGAFLKDAAQGAAEDAAAQAKLAKSLENSIGAWDGQVKAIEKWITKAQFTKGFADTDLRDAFASLTEVTHSVTESQDLMGVAMDLSRAKGIPLASAADILAKAHEGNTKAIKAQLPELGSLIAENASAEEIIAAVATATKGQAAAFADTTQGETAKFHEKLGELEESIGAALLPVMEKLTTMLSGLVDWFSKLSPGVQTAIGVVAGAVAGLVLLNSILTTATAAAAAFGLTLNLSLGPIALVVAAVVGIGVAIYALIKNWDTVKAAIGAGVGAVLGWFKDLGSKIAGLASGMWEPIWGGLQAVLNRAIDLLNAFISAYLTPVKLLNKIPGVSAVIPDALANLKIPHLAGGGPFNGMALVGERGPELIAGAGTVIPNNRLGGVGGNTYNLYVTAIDPAAAQEAVISAIHEYERRNGTDWRT